MQIGGMQMITVLLARATSRLSSFYWFVPCLVILGRGDFIEICIDDKNPTDIERGDTLPNSDQKLPSGLP
jgi:hypothetical protein